MSSRAEPTGTGEYLQSRGQGRLFMRSWLPDPVRAMVAFVHEPGADSVRYSGMAKLLAMRGVASYAIDLRGSASFSARRGGTLSMTHYLDGVRAMTACVRDRHPAQPLFMYGHGAGALAICYFAALKPTAQHSIICEAIQLDPPWRATIFRRFHRLGSMFGAPSMGFISADERLRVAVRSLSSPLLLLHGSEDVMAPPLDSEYIHRYAGSRDKTLQVFEDCDHDLINGCNHALVRDKACQWIEGQLGYGDRRRIGIEYIND